MTDEQSQSTQATFILGGNEEQIQKPPSIISNNSNGSFILSSPGNSGIKSTSPTLKKNKYEKLLGLYKKALKEKQQLGSTNNELEMKKQRYDQLKAQMEGKKLAGQRESQALTEKQRQIEELREIYDNKRRQGVSKEEQYKGKINTAMKEILSLDSMIQEAKKKKWEEAEKEKERQQEQELLAKNEEQQLINNLKFLEEKKLSMQNEISCLEKELKTRKENNEEIQKNNEGFILSDYETEKANLTKRLEQLNLLIQPKLKELEEKKKEIAEAEKNAQKNEAQSIKKEVESLQKQCQQRQKKKASLEQELKEIKKKIKNEENASQKSAKALEKDREKLKQVSKKLEELEDEYRKVAEQVEKIRQGKEKTQFVEVPPRYKELKTRNEHLQQDLKGVQDIYKREKEEADSLVPKQIIDDYKKKVERTKKFYESNKNIKEMNEMIEQQIKNLQVEKDELQWNVNPDIKKLEQNYAKEQTKIKQIEENVKVLQKQSAQVTSKLEEYTKAYPYFEAERQKKKQAAKEKSEKKVEEAKKEETKKKKKGKNAQKSPESQVRSQKSEKVQEKVQEVVKSSVKEPEAKNEKITKKESTQQEKKKKKKKK